MSALVDNWYKMAISEGVDTLETLEGFDDSEAPFDDNPWVSVDSSFIDAIAYFELAKVLEVRLKNGKKYTFVDVPKKAYEAFLQSPSKGTFFNQVVRQNYTKS